MAGTPLWKPRTGAGIARSRPHGQTEVTVFRLELLGMKVTPVDTEEAMTEALTSTLPDVVLIDLDLESGRGIRWVEQIASDECTAHVPIMCISSQGDLAEAESAFKAGARSFLISPYDPAILESKLQALLAVSDSKSASAP